MPNLTELDLSSNRLSGHIPEGAWGNNALGWVDLSNNRLNGSIPCQLLQQVKAPPDVFGRRNLNLSFNDLSGSIPDGLNISDTLILGIDLSNNQLEGPIPSTFSRANVRALSLQNKLSGDLTSLWSSNSSSAELWVLELQGNGVTGEIGPATCANWINLRRLDLSGNPVRLVDNSLSIMLDTFEYLWALNLSSIGSSGNLPARVRNRTFDFILRRLDLSNSSLEGDLSQSLMADAHFLFSSLEFLDLSGNRLTGQVPVSFTVMPRLVFLNLSNNDLSGRLPPLPPALFNAQPSLLAILGFVGRLWKSVGAYSGMTHWCSSS